MGNLDCPGGRCEPGDVFLADCPARLAVDLIADTWAVVVIYGLSDGPRRHGELMTLIGGISKKMLTQTLRRLEASGLVERTVHAQVPVRVDYALTPLGTTLIEPVAMLKEWAARHGAEVVTAQERAACLASSPA